MQSSSVKSRRQKESTKLFLMYYCLLYHLTKIFNYILDLHIVDNSMHKAHANVGPSMKIKMNQVAMLNCQGPDLVSSGLWNKLEQVHCWQSWLECYWYSCYQYCVWGPSMNVSLQVSSVPDTGQGGKHCSLPHWSYIAWLISIVLCQHWQKVRLLSLSFCYRGKMF